MAWLQLRLELGDRDPGAVEAALGALGAMAITLDDAADDPVYEPGPGETPLWPTTRVTALFAADADPDILRAALANALGTDPLPPHEFSALDDRTWEREWLKDFKPMRFGDRLWVVPGEHDPPEPDCVNLRLDPGLAFGTGTHATTALCLEWLDSLDSIRGARVVDYGCGSGILAVAAALLGAAEVLAVDNDPQALVATRVNAERNGVGNRIVVATPEESRCKGTAPTGEESRCKGTAPTGEESRHEGTAPTGGFGVIVANILAAPLVALAPRLRGLAAPGARVAVSGLIERQADAVRAAYADWCPLDEIAMRDGWLRLSGTKR